MDSLNVFIEINGTMNKVGTLSGTNYQDACFTYDEVYLKTAGARGISINLPLQNESFDPKTTKSYFESLLPEGFSRRAVANWAKLPEDDYISLLEFLGKECIGAIQTTKGESESEGGYLQISDEELMELAKEGATKSTELLVETHISLAGASGKVGLYYDEAGKCWYKPYGTAASTHIVKQSHVRLEHLVLNEQLCMLTAAKLNIDVPDSFIINVGDATLEEVLFATKRYDRTRRGNGVDICSPYRLHQEDFAQALGILAKDKYEVNDQDYLKKMFELINNYSANPIEDGLKLWDRVVFNYLIGNTDAHIKNYGLLYSSDLSSIRLAPAYDMVCTRIYGNRNDMSVMINGLLDCTKVTRDDFADMARTVSIGQRIAMNRYDYLQNNLEHMLKESVKEMMNLGFSKAEELGEKILGKCAV